MSEESQGPDGAGKPGRRAKTREQYRENDRRQTFHVETWFEKALWSARFLVLFAVVASVIAALVLFVIGTLDIARVIGEVYAYYIQGNHGIDLHGTVIGELVGSIDIFLIAVVLMIFSFGLYELFISHIDAADDSESSNILEIESLDVLKDKIGQVIIMALIVQFFKIMLALHPSTVTEMLLFACAVAALALALFLMHLGKKLVHGERH